MKVLVLGAGGMAGHLVSLFLRETGLQVDGLSGSQKLDDETHIVDITKMEDFDHFLEPRKYDVVINCVGVLVKQSEERKDLAAYLNAYLPHFLEHFFAASDTKVIHLSTDCVFSGKNAPYREDSAYDGELFYDRSKALGEVRNAKDLTFRMSILGPDMKAHGTGLFNWFMAQDGEIAGYSKAIWSGITTVELAKGIKAAIEQDLTGLYHLVPRASISKCDLLSMLNEAFERGLIIREDDAIVTDKTLVCTRSDFDFAVSDYPTMVKEMKQWIEGHRSIYGHYFKAL